MSIRTFGLALILAFILIAGFNSLPAKSGQDGSRANDESILNQNNNVPGLSGENAEKNRLIGTSLETPYLDTLATNNAIIVINDIYELQRIGNDDNYRLDGSYVLAHDIDASVTADWNRGQGFKPIGGWVGREKCPFTGIFDGAGYKITGLTINRFNKSVGLFYSIAGGAIIKNLELLNADVSGTTYVGCLAGEADSCEIENCKIISSLAYGEGIVGGILGRARKSYIFKCISTADVDANWEEMGAFGGIAGSINKTKVEKCASFSSVNGEFIVGGLLGVASNSKIFSSFSCGYVSGDKKIGGLIGSNFSSDIQDSYSLSTTKAYDSNIAGLIASNDGPVTNSYAAGRIYGTNISGGLIAIDNDPDISNAYWDMETTESLISAGGEGKSTAEMKSQSTYAGWDFANTWIIYEGETYPNLQWQFEDSYIRIIEPNGGEIYSMGEICKIKWNSQGSSALVTLKYSPDAGRKWYVIENSIQNNGTYYWTVPATGANYLKIAVIDTSQFPLDYTDTYFKVTKNDAHFERAWTGSPFQPMNIYCLEADLDEMSLEVGDEIGVFDGDICVGTKFLTRVPTRSKPVYIICSKDDGSGNGFTDGHAIFYKVWDQSDSVEYVASARYFNCDTGDPTAPETFNALASACVELKARSTLTQQIELFAGFNLFSFAVEPEGSHDMLDLLMPILDHVIKVVDENGNVVEKIFGEWQNFIGDWQPTDGYCIQVAQDVNWEITGFELVPPPLLIPLSIGRNIISYPCYASSEDALSVVQPLIDAGFLIKMIDEKGNMVRRVTGNWQNFIGDCQPGEGYYIGVNSSCTLALGCGTGALGANVPRPIGGKRPEHFSVVINGNPFQPMSIYICGAVIQGKALTAGDEIAVYDGDNCVSASVLDHRIDRNAPLQIIASKANGEENGFTDGNRIWFRIWRQEDGLELAVDPTAVRFLDKNSGGLIPAVGFEALGTVVVEIQQQPAAIAINEVIPEWYKLYQNYPNPFNMATKIYYDLPEDADVILDIYDITGRLVKSLVRSRQKAGQYGVEWDGRNENGLTVGTGVYLCKMLTEHYVQTLKLILVK